jgi:hypothetical protein
MKFRYSSFVFFTTRSPSFVIPAKQYLRFTQHPDWTALNKSGRPKKAEQRKSGLEEAMAKAKGEKKPPKMKRRRCAICGKWNHKMGDCFVLTRPKNDKEMTMIVPVETTVNVTGGGTMEGTTVNHVTGGGTMDGTTVYHVNGGGTMEDDGQEGAI